jgi:hypothetical protein
MAVVDFTSVIILFYFLIKENNRSGQMAYHAYFQEFSAILT